MDSPKHGMHIRWSDEDGCFVVTVPELPGCTTHGDTWAMAARAAEVARDLWLEMAEEMGREIPEPGAQRAPICSGCGLPMTLQFPDAGSVEVRGCSCKREIVSVPAVGYRCFACDHSVTVAALLTNGRKSNGKEDDD